MKRLDTTEIVFKILSYVILTIFALACLFPFVFILANSISSKTATEASQITIIPDAFNPSAYQFAFERRDFWLAYCNSFFVTIYGTLVSMLVGICGAYALSKPRLLFGRGFNFMLVFTMWFNAGMIPTYTNFRRFGVNNIYMFIVALGFNAFNIILLRNYFSSIPTEIEEAATIDGATDFQILTRIYIPMSKSSIVTVAMFYAVARWNGYIWAQMLLVESDYPLTVYIRITIEKFTTQLEADPSTYDKYNFSLYSVRYAFLVCSIIPIIIVYPKLQKYFAAGVNVGGVKE